ncbi:MAG: DNA damage-inducible protein D [Gammaproteobacteria bacterium]
MNAQPIEKAVKDQLDATRKTANQSEPCWLARDLQEVLNYRHWDNFKQVLKKAQQSCVEAGGEISDHFHRTAKMVNLGSGSKREVDDYILSRFACYLIAMNGDPGIPQIASAQNYFALQTIRMEQVERSSSAADRVEMREKVTEANKSLMEAAQTAGVKRFGIFNDSGYRGMYNLSLRDLKEKKEIGKDNLLDRAGHSELAANYFRITQADDKIRRENVQGEQKANDTHFAVGKQVRDTIDSIGGTMPEDLPTEENIKNLPEYKAAKKISPLNNKG